MWTWMEAFMRRRQRNSPSSASNSDRLVGSIKTQEADSYLLIYVDEPAMEVLRAAGSAASAVPPVENISNAESGSADDIIEAEPGDIYMRQRVIIKTKDGGDYVFDEAQIDTANDAEYMLINRRLVKNLGLKEKPVLGHAEIQGINGPSIRPTTFVTMEFKMPQLELDWVIVNAYVIDGNVNVGFNLGNRAILKFDLLGKLHELQQTIQGWVIICRRRGESTARSVNTVVSKRSEAQKREDAKRHQDNSPLAAGISNFREQWQSGAPGRQHTYAPSTGSSDNSATAASTAGGSHASTRSTSATCFTTVSSGQEQKV